MDVSVIRKVNAVSGRRIAIHGQHGIAAAEMQMPGGGTTLQGHGEKVPCLGNVRSKGKLLMIQGQSQQMLQHDAKKQRRSPVSISGQGNVACG